MSPFLKAAKRAIGAHGITSVYKTRTQPSYDVETGTSSQTEVSITLKLFPKAVKVNQFNYPNLIGKTVIKFLALGDAGISPSTDDVIVFNSEVYTIDSYTEHYADSQVILWQILCVKS